MSNWRSLARQYAQKHGINQTLFERQMGQEAHGADLRSPAGAQGPAQIMPGTARAWGVKNVHDINQAYDAAAAHMAGYLKQFGGSWAKALTAYNAGPGAVGGKLPAETQHYISTILGGHVDLQQPGSKSAPSYGVKNSKVTEPATTTQDVEGAIMSALLSKPKPGKLGITVLRKLAYDPNYAEKTKPGKTYNIASPTTSAPAAGRPHGDGIVMFDGKPVAAWVAAELHWARAHGWKGTVSSGVRTDAEQTRIYKSGVRPAAVPKSMGGPGSNHEGIEFPRGAVDVTDAATLAKLLRKRGSPLVWAGSKDPVHFSHPHGGSY